MVYLIFIKFFLWNINGYNILLVDFIYYNYLCDIRYRILEVKYLGDA